MGIGMAGMSEAGACMALGGFWLLKRELDFTCTGKWWFWDVLFWAASRATRARWMSVWGGVVGRGRVGFTSTDMEEVLLDAAWAE